MEEVKNKVLKVYLTLPSQLSDCNISQVIHLRSYLSKALIMTVKQHETNLPKPTKVTSRVQKEKMNFMKIKI